MDIKDFIKEKTNEAVKDYTESIDDNIRDVLTSGTTVNYANTARTSEIPSTDTLSIEDIQKAMHSLREAERIRQKYITKKVSSPGYQDTVNECVRIIEWLWKKKTWKYKKLVVVHRIYTALMPDNFFPVHSKIVEQYEEIRKEYYVRNNS